MTSTTSTSTPFVKERPIRSEFDYQIRIYRDEDKMQVHSLFMNAMLWDSHSPLVPFMKAVISGPVAKCLYAVSFFGVLLRHKYPTIGLTISLAAPGIVVLQMSILFLLFLKMLGGSLRDDMADIRSHYQLDPIDENGVELELRASGPKGFWVVEATHRGHGKREIAACGGLDIVQREGKEDTDLRRIAVSGRHVRQGLAKLLVNQIIEHAKKHKLSSIYLSTSIMQEPAINLYKKLGWVELARKKMYMMGVPMGSVHMRLYLKGKPEIS